VAGKGLPSLTNGTARQVVPVVTPNPPTARMRDEKGGRESACKPGSVEDSHSSSTCVAARLQRPTRELAWAHCNRSPIRSCFGWGLPCHKCYHLRGALLPHHFTLTGLAAGGIFSAALSV